MRRLALLLAPLLLATSMSCSKSSKVTVPMASPAQWSQALGLPGIQL